MIQIYEGSVLELQGYELISVSHSVKIAENQYYLIEIFNKKIQKKLYVWEQKEIIASFFHKSISDFQQLRKKGRQLQIQTRWPLGKVVALQQIRKKFLAQHSESSDHNYEFQQQMKEMEEFPKQNEKNFHKNVPQEKQSKIQKNKMKATIYENREHAATVITSLVSQKRLQYGRQRNQMNENILKKQQISQKMRSENEEKVKEDKYIDEFELTTNFMQKMKKKAQKQHPVEYYKIKKMKIQPKKRQINYIVDNILGQSQYISGRKLKKTHLFDMIVFLEDYLQIKK